MLFFLTPTRLLHWAKTVLTFSCQGLAEPVFFGKGLRGPAKNTGRNKQVEKKIKHVTQYEVFFGGITSNRNQKKKGGKDDNRGLGQKGGRGPIVMGANKERG